jgi:hypothetical protein
MAAYNPRAAAIAKFSVEDYRERGSVRPSGRSRWVSPPEKRTFMSMSSQASGCSHRRASQATDGRALPSSTNSRTGMSCATLPRMDPDGSALTRGDSHLGYVSG